MPARLTPSCQQDPHIVVIARAHAEDLQQRLTALVTNSPDAQGLLAAGWTIQVSKGRRGYCYYRTKTITIPEHALFASKGLGYDRYYLAHEMAHAKAGKRAAHGPDFMAWLKRLCPPDFLHFELGYKPRNARAAGICHPARPLAVPQPA